MFLLKTMFKVIFSLIITQAFCNNYISLKRINRENLKAPSDIIFNRSKIFDPKESYKKQEEEEEDFKFVPTKIYTQVRASHVIERVPRQEAVNADASEESNENAANLKEVITNKKISTVYTEEGYEDAAYDHGGRIRDANYNEDYTNKFYNHNVKKAAKPYEKNKHPNSADVDNFHTYANYPKTLKILPSSVKERDQTNMKDKRKDKHFKKLLKSRIYPKLLVNQGIRQLERDVENNNSYKPSKESHLQYTDNDSDNVKEGQHLKPAIKHVSKKKSRKRLNNDPQKSIRNYVTLDRNKHNKNDLILDISPNTSKVVKTIKKSLMEPNSVVNHTNIYDNFFRKEKDIKYPFKSYSNFKIQNYNDSLSNTADILPVLNRNFESSEGIIPIDFLRTISSDEPLFNTFHFYPIQNKNVQAKYLIRKKRSKRKEYRHLNIERNYNKPSIKIRRRKEEYPFSRKSTNEMSINPMPIPKKTFGGMEFYESRKSLLCDEVNPYVKELDSLNQNSSRKQELSTKSSRLPGLQTQFECLKEKYFDNLNNPLFSMSQMEQPVLPHILHKMKLMSKKLTSKNDLEVNPISSNKKYFI